MHRTLASTNEVIMRWRVALAAVLLVVGLASNGDAAVNTIVGMNVDASTPPAPTGFCGGSFNMTYDSTLTVPLGTVDAGSFVTFRAAPLENGFDGVGYGLAMNGANTVLSLLTFDLSVNPTSVNAVAAISTANVPDAAADSGQPVVYDSTKANAFVVLGRQASAPCNIAQCVHIRGFTNTTAGTDIQDTTLSISSVNGAYVIPGDSYWTVATTSGQVLAKYTTGYTRIGGVTVLSPGNVYVDFAHDDAYLYAVVLLGGTYNIRRINRATLAIVSDTPYTSVQRTSLIHVNGFLYMGQAGLLEKIDTATMGVVGTMTLGVLEAPHHASAQFDTVNDRLYMALGNAGGVSTNIRRINLNTFVSEQTLGIPLRIGNNGIGFDLQHKRIWSANNTGSGVGNQMQVSRVTTCP